MHKNFCAQYNGGEVDVSFCLNRYPIRNQHAALRGFGHQIPEATVFPTAENFSNFDRRRFRWLHPFPVAIRMISGLNRFQTMAVKNVLEGRGDFYLGNPILRKKPMKKFTEAEFKALN